MSVSLSLFAGAGWQFFDSNGIPLAGGLLYTYAAGTTTPQITYTTNAGSIANSNPIVLNSAGRTPNEIWLTSTLTYKFLVKNSVGTEIASYDNIGGSFDSASLSSSSGSSLIGFIQSGSGAVAKTVQTKLRQNVSVLDFGAVGDGVTDDTAAIQAALNSSSNVNLVEGYTYLITQLSMPSNTRLWGRGALKVKNSTNNNAIINGGSTNIVLEGFSLDGNYANQTSGSGIVLSTVTNSAIKNVTVTNVYGTGILISAGSKNSVTGCVVSGCGQNAAGYGIYLFASSYNLVCNNTVSNNCIGIVIETSGVLTALYNTITGNVSTANRAAFTQSGAGIHIECSAGNSVNYTEVSGNTSSLNAGPGVSQTNGVGNNFTGNQLSNNSLAGISTAVATNTLISGNTCIANGAGAAAGYQCGFLFDSAGSGSTGLVIGNEISGSVEGVKTFGTSALVFVGNDVRNNSSSAMNLSGTGTDVTANNKGFDWFTREPNPPVALFDDFAGVTLNAGIWTGTKGSDAACALPAVLTGQLRGLIQMTTGANAAATYAANGVQIDSALNWQSSIGAMVFEARVTISSVIASMALFVGVTDQAGGLGIPFQSSGVGDGVTANRTNACGWLYDTAMTTANWWLVGNSSTGSATPQNAGVAPVQSTFETFRIEFPATGSTAYFFRNGVLVGTQMTNALYFAAPVTPVISAFSRSASARNIQIDYIKMSMSR